MADWHSAYNDGATALQQMQRMGTATRGRYGLDAPRFVYVSAVKGALSATIGLALVITNDLFAVNLIGYLVFLVASWFLAQAATHLWGSRIGKLRVRDRILRSIQWRGDERVLDVGCGSGLMLIGAAKHLTSGSAVGVDIWSPKDQSSNRPETTLENAKIEGVLDHVQIKEGDARSLPFPDSSFDIALSSLVIHNIPQAEGREKAIREIVRVLRKGGQAHIFDLRNAWEYARVFDESGMSNVRVSPPFFLFMKLCRITSAMKPA